MRPSARPVRQFRHPERSGASTATNSDSYERILEMHGRFPDVRRPGPVSVQVLAGPRVLPAKTPVRGNGGKRSASPGFCAAYVEGSDDPEADLRGAVKVRLPRLSAGDGLAVESCSPRAIPPNRHPVIPRRLW